MQGWIIIFLLLSLLCSPPPAKKKIDAADPACDDDNCDYLLPGVPNEDMDVSTAGIEHVAHQMVFGRDEKEV